MSYLTIADLPPRAISCASSRGLLDVFLGHDSALPLIEASSSGNLTALQAVLAEPDAASRALERQHVIYHDQEPDHAKDAERDVLMMPMSNIQRAIMKAAQQGQASVIPVLAKFAKAQCCMRRAPFLDRLVLVPLIRKNDVAVLQALGEAWPASLTIDMERWGTPLDVALNFEKWAIVTMLLEQGVSGRSLTKKSRRFTYQSSLPSLSAEAEGTHMADALLKQEFPVNGSGALHYAAELGRLDLMTLVLDHRADVDELLPEAGLAMAKDPALCASWTPLHFAASTGQLEAMKLLEEHGARILLDANGKTPAQLLSKRDDEARS